VLEEFELLQVPSHIATDDGSAGYHGFVTDKVRHWLRLANDFNLPCQVSMERMMACGIGLCQSCAVEVKSDAGDTKYRLCCKDGPVFNANDVLFHKA
jgi:dihydroorotate dehydrogenase electron transfer subunit